jgi:hypothetical protein
MKTHTGMAQLGTTNTPSFEFIQNVRKIYGLRIHSQRPKGDSTHQAPGRFSVIFRKEKLHERSVPKR